PPSGRGGLALVGGPAVATGGLCVVYMPYAWIRALEPNLRYQTWWGFVREVTMNVPWGLVMHSVRPTSVSFPFLDLIAIGIVARLVPRAARTEDERTAWRQGFLWAVVGALLSLTPIVRIGDSVYRMPHADLIDRFPGLDLLRDPHRMGVGALFGLAILAGASFAECVRWFERVVTQRDPRWLRGTAAVAFVLLCSGIVWAPLELRVSPWPGEYPLMAARVPDGPIMDALRRPGGPLLQMPSDPSAPFAHHLPAPAIPPFP